MENALMGTGVATWLLAIVFFRSHRNWLPYYVIGAVGLAFIFIAVGRSLIPFEDLLKGLTALGVHQVAALGQVETRVFPAVPGALVVPNIPENQGWTVLNIGIESSGMLEMAVIIGMVGFYPAWSLQRRVGVMALAILATYAANVVRIGFIVASIHWGGKDVLFISHTVIGRAIFFLLVVAIFWFAFSLPTLRTLHRRIRGPAQR